MNHTRLAGVVVGAVLALAGCGHEAARMPLVRAVPPPPTTTTSTSTSTTTTTAPPPPQRPQKAQTSRGAPRHRSAAQSASVPSGGDFWARLAACESPHGADDGQYGGYFQMTDSSWANGGGTGGHAHGTYDEQKAVAQAHAARSNPYKQWPTCWPIAKGGG